MHRLWSATFLCLTAGVSNMYVGLRCVAEMPGHEHVSYKGKLAELNLPFHPRSWHIRKCVWHGKPPPAHMDDGQIVWFLKDTLRSEFAMSTVPIHPSIHSSIHPAIHTASYSYSQLFIQPTT